MKKITKTQQLAAGVLVLALVLGGLYYLTIGQLNTLKAERNALIDEQASLELLRQAEQETRTLLAETEEQRASLAAHLVPVENPTEFIELIETIARTVGVAMEVSKIAAESIEDKHAAGTNAPMMCLLLTVDLSGNWSAVYRFTRLIEYAPYALTVTRATFSEEESGTWNGTVDIRCSGE
jgi:hypothetical protein